MNDVTAAAKKWKLLITEGVHQGAEVFLDENTLTIIGSDEECELILRDEGVAARHLAVIVQSNSVVIRALDGALKLDGHQINDKQINLVATNAIDLEPSAVQVKIIRIKPRSNEAKEQELESAFHAVKHQQNPPSNVTKLLWVISTIVLCGLIAGGSMTIADKHVSNDSKHEILSLETILTAMQLNDRLSLTRLGDRQLVNGVLTKNERSNFEKEVQSISGQVLIKTITPDQLLEQVGNVFRTNGYTAQLRYQGRAGVEVQNLDGNQEEVKKIAAHIEQDVAHLKSLTFAPQIQQSDKREDVEYQIDPNKRMTAIVDGDIAYVSTLDGARYFTGSVLPGGYTIREISEKGVKVNREDETLWVYF